MYKIPYVEHMGYVCHIYIYMDYSTWYLIILTASLRLHLTYGSTLWMPYIGIANTHPVPGGNPSKLNYHHMSAMFVGCISHYIPRYSINYRAFPSLAG